MIDYSKYIMTNSNPKAPSSPTKATKVTQHALAEILGEEGARQALACAAKARGVVVTGDERAKIEAHVRSLMSQIDQRILPERMLSGDAVPEGHPELRAFVGVREALLINAAASEASKTPVTADEAKRVADHLRELDAKLLARLGESGSLTPATGVPERLMIQERSRRNIKESVIFPKLPSKGLSQSDVVASVFSEFGLANEKMRSQVIYILISSDWHQSEIKSPFARSESFAELSRSFATDLMKGLSQLALDDATRFPGPEPLEIRVVSTTPEQNSALASRKSRLKMKMLRADVFVSFIRNPEDASASMRELDLFRAQRDFSPFVLNDTEANLHLQLGVAGAEVGLRATKSKDRSAEGALWLAKQLSGAQAKPLSIEALKSLIGNTSPLQRWTLSLFLKIRGLACQRGMINAQAMYENLIDPLDRHIALSGSGSKNLQLDPVIEVLDADRQTSALRVGEAPRSAGPERARDVHNSPKAFSDEVRSVIAPVDGNRKVIRGVNISPKQVWDIVEADLAEVFSTRY